MDSSYCCVMMSFVLLLKKLCYDVLSRFTRPIRGDWEQSACSVARASCSQLTTTRSTKNSSQTTEYCQLRQPNTFPPEAPKSRPNPSAWLTAHLHIGSTTRPGERWSSMQLTSWPSLHRHQLVYISISCTLFPDVSLVLEPSLMLQCV